MDENYKYTPLIEPIPIIEQVWTEGTIPLVHTRTMTYNHENFIRDCIEGILIQKTTFPVQVLIHDDASCDKTASIIKEYELKYPHLIKVFYQEENSYSSPDKIKKREMFNSWRIGKYEALCEGDDYWINPLKLQKQVELLEQNPQCSICFHSTLIKTKSKEYVVHNHGNSNKIFDSDKLISGEINMWTASILVKTDIVKSIPTKLNKLRYGDVRLKIWAASKGCVAYVGGEPMSVYRRGVKGAWSENEGKDIKWEKQRLNDHYEVVKVFKEILPIKYHKALEAYKKRVEKSHFFLLNRYYSGIDLFVVLLKNLKYINYNIFLPFWVKLKIQMQRHKL